MWPTPGAPDQSAADAQLDLAVHAWTRLLGRDHRFFDAHLRAMREATLMAEDLVSLLTVPTPPPEPPPPRPPPRPLSSSRQPASPPLLPLPPRPRPPLPPPPPQLSEGGPATSISSPQQLTSASTQPPPAPTPPLAAREPPARPQRPPPHQRIRPDPPPTARPRPPHPPHRRPGRRCPPPAPAAPSQGGRLWRRLPRPLSPGRSGSSRRTSLRGRRMR